MPEKRAFTFYPEEQAAPKTRRFTFYPEELPPEKPSLQQLAEQSTTLREFQKKAGELGYEAPPEMIHALTRPEEKPVSVYGEALKTPSPSLLDLFPKPAPAEALTTVSPERPRFIIPTLRGEEPLEPKPPELRLPREEEPSILEANLQSLLRVLKFPITAGLEVEETLKPLGKKGLAKYIPAPTTRTGKWLAQMAAGIGLAPVELVYTISQLNDPAQPLIHVIGRGWMPREEITKEILSTVPEQAVKVMIGKGMLRRAGAVVRGARMGWRGVPAREPVTALAEEAGIRPLERLEAAEAELAGVPEAWRRSPAEYELLKRRLRAMEPTRRMRLPREAEVARAEGREPLFEPQEETINIDTPERWELRNSIIERSYAEGAKTKEKIADLVLGLPAGGKNVYFAEPLARRTGAILIDSDIYKKQLPEYNRGLGSGLVHKESSDIIETAIFEKAVKAGDNIVLPRLGKNTETIKNLIAQLDAYGYEVNVHFVDIPVKEAMRRAETRFREGGHYVRPKFIEEVGERPGQTYRIIKGEKGVNSYAKWTTDVPFGEAARLIEASPTYDRLRSPGQGYTKLGGRVEKIEPAEEAPQVVRPVEAARLPPEKYYYIDRKQVRPETFAEQWQKEFPDLDPPTTGTWQGPRHEYSASRVDRFAPEKPPPGRPELDLAKALKEKGVKPEGKYKAIIGQRRSHVINTETGEIVPQTWFMGKAHARRAELAAKKLNTKPAPQPPAAKAKEPTGITFEDVGRLIVEQRKKYGDARTEAGTFYERYLRGKRGSKANLAKEEKLEKRWQAEKRRLEELEAIQDRISEGKQPTTKELAEYPELAKGKAPAVSAAKKELLIRTLRQKAEAMQKQIDAKRSPAIAEQRPTARRSRIAASMMEDAEHLERVQGGLRAIADATERGTLPESLSGIKSRAELETLMRYRDFPPKKEGWLDDYNRMVKAGITDAAKFRQAKADMAELSRPLEKTPEELRAKELAEKEREMRFRKEKGFFITPKPLAESMARRAEIKPGDSVLEPSAGLGNIAEQLPKDQTKVIELNATRAELLEAKGYDLVDRDFLEHTQKYDKIVMNPPFEKFQDIDHVRHAYTLLNPGGKIVSIVSESPFFRSDKKAVEFRSWLEEVGGTSEKLPSGTFKEAGTGVTARLVEIEKPPAEVKAVAPEAPGMIPEVPEYTGYEKMNMLKSNAGVRRLRHLYDLRDEGYRKVSLGGKTENLETVIRRTEKQRSVSEKWEAEELRDQARAKAEAEAAAIPPPEPQIMRQDVSQFKSLVDLQGAYRDLTTYQEEARVYSDPSRAELAEAINKKFDEVRRRVEELGYDYPEDVLAQAVFVTPEGVERPWRGPEKPSYPRVPTAKAKTRTVAAKVAAKKNLLERIAKAKEGAPEETAWTEEVGNLTFESEGATFTIRNNKRSLGEFEKAVKAGYPTVVYLHSGVPLGPLRAVNQIVRFMDDVVAKHVTKPLHQRISTWVRETLPTVQEFWDQWGSTLVKANPELAQFMRRFRGGAEMQKLAVREAAQPLLLKEGEPLTTVYGKRFRAEAIKRRLGQLMAPTTIRPGRQPRAKYWPARPSRTLSELVEMTPEELIETKARVGKTMTRPEADAILEHARQVKKDLAARGIKKEEIPLPEASVTPVPRFREAVMGARLVEAELGKALYDLGLLTKGAFKQFYGIHLKRMYESIELEKQQAVAKPGLRMGPAKKLRLKMLRERGITAIREERARWTKEIEATRKELAKIKIENVRGLGKHMAWRLKDAGYTTLDKLLAATPEELMENIKGIGKKRAASFKAQAERFLLEKKPKLLKQYRLQRGMKQYAWMRVDLPLKWQMEAGRYMTPDVPFLKGSYATIYNIQAGKLLKDIGAPKFRDKFWSEIETTEFSERIPETKEGGRFVYGDLAGKYVTKKVLAEIKPFLELPTETNRMLNAWLGLWKMGKVAGAIGTQMRNFWFNVGPLADFARVGLKDYIIGGKEYAKRGERYRELLKEGYLETDYMGVEVEDALRSLSRFKEENLGVASAQWLRNYLGRVGFNKAVKGYQAVDQIHKMAVYMKNLREGVPKAQAFEQVYRWCQNYREVPQMAHWLRTHATGYVAPFLTFSFEAARFLKNAAVERPITLAKWVTVPFLLRAWAQKKAGLSDKEMNQLVGSLPKDRSLYSSLLVPAKKKGRFHLVDLSYTFPWMDIYEKLGRPQDVLLGSPIFKTTMELYTGIDSWTGKPILKPEDTNSIDQIRRWADHLYRQMVPSTAPEIPGLTEGGYEWRRIARILKKRKDYYGEPYPTGPALLHTFAGVPIRSFDLKRELMWRQKEIDSKIETLSRRQAGLKYNRAMSMKQKLVIWHKLQQEKKRLWDQKVNLVTGKR